MAGIGEVGDQQAPTKKLKLYDGHVSSAGSKTLFETPPFSGEIINSDSDDERIRSDIDDERVRSDTDDDMYYSVSEEASAEYDEKLKTSGGFDVDEVKGCIGLIFPVDLKAQSGTLMVVKELSEMAIDMYNKDHGTNYKVVDIVKVNLQMADGFKHYITFEASDVAKDVGVKIFQAIGVNGVPDKETRAKNLVVELCKVKGT